MLISPSEKKSTAEEQHQSSDVNEDELTRTEISIDLSRLPPNTPKSKKNITIQITNLDDISSNLEDSRLFNTSSPLTKDKLIKLKIKMPKSPKTPKSPKSPKNHDLKRDKSFFTEKDFSTLPKEFIKFANSMICGDGEPKKEIKWVNSEAKKRYCDKTLNEERRTKRNVDKEFGALSPINQDTETLIPSSTFKEADEKFEPDYSFLEINESKEIEGIQDDFSGVKICDVIEKRKVPETQVTFKPYEDIIAKLKPYSKYRMQYLHNLRKLQNKECNKYPKEEFYVPTTEQTPKNTKNNNLFDLDENKIIQLVNQSSKYRPLMGKNALYSKMKKTHPENDSKIIKDLVTEKFSPFFDRRRKERRDNNYSLPIDSLNYNKEQIQKINNNLNQTIHRIVVNEEVYAVINKNNKSKELDLKSSFNGNQEIELWSEMKTETDLKGEIKSELKTEVKTEFSAQSDYDIEKFLQNAIGDVSLLSQTMDVSNASNIVLKNEEDHSIATGEMSLLVSKASSISTFCSAIWRRVARRNSAIAPQEEKGTENEEQLRKEERNKRITLLQQESSVQNEIIRQASKALDYCEHLPGIDFLSQRVEAERVILIATHKNKMIQHEIEDVTYYSTIRTTCNYLGTFKIENLEFKIKEVYPKLNNDYSQWYVCVINRGTETLASSAVQAQEDGSVIFKEDFSFDYLPPDFEVGVSVFTLKVKKAKENRSTLQRMKFFSFRRNPKPSATKTLTSRFSKTSLRSPNKEYALQTNPIRQTSFLLLGETTITIKDVQKNKLSLTNLVNFANILENFSASMYTSVNIDETYSDFLNIGTENGENIIWNRRWCTLLNTQFKYWNSPNDEETDEPLKTIDLTYSIRDVLHADRSICPRAKTLQLDVLIPLQPNGDQYTIERYFLTSDTSESMHNWDKYFNSIISTLRAWNCIKSTGGC
ncbi:putative autophagy-related protein 11 isoform X2 [Onthophagus taurus]|uniref:putative autophagy-related protein 11 isoform X2 n=1 Tax=Onthophagus taurus TaxID=166361 RepID=UPI000C2020CF|nr:uncharacterized protein LOC111419649 isoform X2 [Onthophagus taurus]